MNKMIPVVTPLKVTSNGLMCIFKAAEIVAINTFIEANKQYRMAIDASTVAKQKAVKAEHDARTAYIEASRTARDANAATIAVETEAVKQAKSDTQKARLLFGKISASQVHDPRYETDITNQGYS